MAHVNTGLSRREAAPEDFRVNTFWGWHIKADRDAAYAESRRELPWRARLLDPTMINMYLDEEENAIVQKYKQEYVDFYFDPTQEVKNIPVEISNKLAEGLTSTGGMEDIDREIERYRQFERAGLTEIALRLHGDPMDALKIIGERVVPVMRA